jgi:hypothetical protein
MDALRKPVWVLAAVWVLLGPGDGRSAFEPILRVSPPSNLELLVKNTVWNELQARKHPAARFEYREIDESSGHSTASTEIETPEGVVGKEIEENGGPLTDDERSRNEHQLQELVRNLRRQRQLLESQQEEARRRMGLLKDFPSAFLFQFDGVEPNGVVRLKFRPNPRFQPPSKEDLVLRGMAGTLWIDPRSQRLVKIDGTLIRDVTLGWGLVVRLYRGGHFVMKQAEVGKGCWRTTLLAVDLTGKILLVKGLKVQMEQIREAFRQVVSNLTVRQAVAMLQTYPP